MAALGAGDREFPFFAGEPQSRLALRAFVVGVGPDFPQLAGTIAEAASKRLDQSQKRLVFPAAFGDVSGKETEQHIEQDQIVPIHQKWPADKRIDQYDHDIQAEQAEVQLVHAVPAHHESCQ